MLSHGAGAENPTRLFGTYNTVATLAGSLGALIALLGTSAEWLLIYPVAAAAGLLASSRLSAVVELGHELEEDPLPPLHRSRGIVMRLSGLFALDSFGGGFVPQTFIAYLFARRPVAPLLAGPAATLALGAPFVIAGALKSVYDLGLYRLFRRIPIDES